MPSILNTSLSGLLSFQRSMATTSHNIANVNTPGYSRQKANLTAQPGQAFAYGSIGVGVRVDSVEQIRDQFIETRLRSAITDDGRTRMYAELAGQLDSLLASEDTGLSPALVNFFSAAQSLANDPSSMTSRQLMLSEGAVLADRFHFMDAEVQGLQSQMNNRISALVADVNAYADDIARLNDDIGNLSLGSGRTAPNDLLDQRNERINQLSTLVGLTTLVQENGAVSVFSSSGQAIVLNGESFHWGTVEDKGDPSQLQVTNSIGGVLGHKLSGGELGGVFDFRRETYNTARNELGRIAAVLVDTVNTQHRLGVDANGALGQDFFTTSGPEVVARTNNTGTATLTAAITDSSQLQISEYLVDFDGANYTMTRVSDGVAVSGAGPLTLDGVQISVSAGAVAGDRFHVRPVTTVARDIELAFSDLGLIAAAGPVRSRSANANIGGGVMQQPAAVDASNPALSNTVNIVFNSPASTYDVIDVTAGSTLAAGVAYVAGASITANGWSTSISAVPVAGDTFTIQANTGGQGDNRNMLNIATLQTSSVVDGSMSFQQAYSTFVGRSGVTARTAQISADAHDQLLVEVRASRESISGVNLDEEAVNLTRDQQAYQAMARMVDTSNTLFDTLMSVFR